MDTFSPCKNIKAKLGYFVYNQIGRPPEAEIHTQLKIGEKLIALFFQSLKARIRRVKYRLAGMTPVKFIIALLRKLARDDISNMASSISYFAFLSLFPLLLGLLAIFSLILPPETIRNELIGFFGQYLPGSLGILQGSIFDIVRFRGVFGLVGAWRSSAHRR